MPIVSGELLFYRGAVHNDTIDNGGLMSSAVIADGVKNSVFPDVSQAERVAGITQYRKLFLKVDNVANIALQNPTLFIEKVTPGDDVVTLFVGTQSDTQNDITGSERQYGGGTLDADVLLGSFTLDVLVEDPTNGIFADGDTVRVSDAVDVLTAGTTEDLVIDTGGVSYLGNVATLTFTTALLNDYTVAAGTKVSTRMPVTDITTAVTGVVVTSAAGTYDDGANPIQMENKSTIEETWTLDFTSSTAFNIVGATVGLVGSGSVSTGAAPTNPAYAMPYFTLLAAGFGGSFLTGDTIVFTTSPASSPVWAKRVVPPAAGSLSGNNFVMAVEGESA